MTGRSRRTRQSILVTLLFSSTTAISVAQAVGPGTASVASTSRSHVVLAVIENAVNVYHHDFAAPDRTASPASWLPGYPSTSKPLRLHLHETTFAAARASDDRVWAGLRPQQLYYIPGTRFSGLIYLPSPIDVTTSQQNIDYPPPANPPRPVIDGYTYHGTGVASVSAGTKYGTCPDCDIVVVAADDEEAGLAWAARQPWIDVISNSWGGKLGLPTQAMASHPQLAADTTASAGSLSAATAGKAVVFGSGNGVTDLGPTTHGMQHSLTWDTPYAGPPWVLTVGAAKAKTGQPTDWHNIPVDVIAQGEDRPAADSGSLSGQETFIGTSCSAPIAAGVLAEALYKARVVVGDRHVGPNHGSLLTPATRLRSGPTADGVLTYAELLVAAESVAAWRPFDPASVVADPIQAFATPTTPLGYAYEGFGLLDKPAVASLARVLLGQAIEPSRPEMREWATLASTARSSRWGSEPEPR